MRKHCKRDVWSSDLELCGLRGWFLVNDKQNTAVTSAVITIRKTCAKYPFFARANLDEARETSSLDMHAAACEILLDSRDKIMRSHVSIED